MLAACRRTLRTVLASLAPKALLTVLSVLVEDLAGVHSESSIIVDNRLPETVRILSRTKHMETQLFEMDMAIGDFESMARHIKPYLGVRAILVRVNAECLSRRTIRLPRKSEQQLDNVIKYELRRLLAVEPSEVVWGWDIIARGKRYFSVTVFAIPTLPYRRLVELLQHDPRIKSVAIESVEDHRTLTIRSLHKKNSHSTVKPLLAAAIVGTLSCLPLADQAIELYQIRSILNSQSPGLKVVRDAQQKILALKRLNGLIDSRVGDSGIVLQTLALITNALPDDCYLQRLSILRHMVSLDGVARSAPSIVRTLSTTPGLSHPLLTAPVTQTGGRMDQFSMTVQVGVISNGSGQAPIE